MDIRIDIKNGEGIEAIHVYADSSRKRAESLKTLLDINEEIENLDGRVRRRAPSDSR